MDSVIQWFINWASIVGSYGQLQQLPAFKFPTKQVEGKRISGSVTALGDINTQLQEFVKTTAFYSRLLRLQRPGPEQVKSTVPSFDPRNPSRWIGAWVTMRAEAPGILSLAGFKNPGEILAKMDAFYNAYIAPGIKTLAKK